MHYRLVHDKQSEYIIVAYRYADETVRFAAAELQKYILKSTGAVIPYFSDRCPPVEGTHEIRIGENVRGKTSDLSSVDEEGFRIFGDGEDLVITGRTGRGVLYGVYRFLEIYLGFRCFTKDIETIRQTEELYVDDPLITESPAFEYREAYYRFAFDGGFASKNRLNSNLADLSKGEGGKTRWYNFHHSFHDLVPPEKYFSSHPEYFSEVDGKRIDNGQICLSNEDVFSIARDQLREWIRENPDCTVFSVAQNDNRRYCTCAKCRETDEAEGSPAGTILRFVNRLAEDIEKDYPNVLLHTFAYQYSVPCPKITKAHSNVIIRLCDISCRFDQPLTALSEQYPSGAEAQFLNALKEWQKRCNHLYVWDYCVDFAHYLLPFFHFHTLAENIKTFRDNGVRGVLQEGNFAYGGGAGNDDAISYLIAKLLWNPDTDVDAVTDEYFNGVYGTAAEYIKAYYALWEKSYDGNELAIYVTPDAGFVTEERISESEALFEKAKEAAKTPEILRRVERQELAVRYLRLWKEPDSPERNEHIRRFFDDVRSHGITEIQERTPLPASEDALIGRFPRGKSKKFYRLYYIMQ